jgi:SAM-dependent methyltransferase
MKTTTDLHWDTRSRTETDARKVNIADLTQRAIENDFVLPRITPTDDVLEAGCGNGYLTSEISRLARRVDAFDYSEGMVDAARAHHPAANVRFFVHSILDSSQIDRLYDTTVCVRVLINLANLDEQRSAVANLARWTKPGGTLLLVEGFVDGFEGLDAVRDKAGLPTLRPAKINFYSRVADLMPVITQHFELIERWNSGMYDLLTRVAFPLLVGPENAGQPSDFHEKVLPLARQIVAQDLARYARVHGFVLQKR